MRQHEEGERESEDGWLAALMEWSDAVSGERKGRWDVEWH